MKNYGRKSNNKFQTTMLLHTNGFHFSGGTFAFIIFYSKVLVSLPSHSHSLWNIWPHFCAAKHSESELFGGPDGCCAAVNSGRTRSPDDRSRNTNRNGCRRGRSMKEWIGKTWRGPRIGGFFMQSEEWLVWSRCLFVKISQNVSFICFKPRSIKMVPRF